MSDLVMDFEDQPKGKGGKGNYWGNFDDLNNTAALEELADAQ